MTDPARMQLVAERASAALRSLLYEFHAEQRTSLPTKNRRVVMTAELARDDFTSRVNELAAVDREIEASR